MIRENFLKFIYEAASMQRWNDHIRPHTGFAELDKQAHKMFFAYMIGNFEEDAGTSIDWSILIEGAIFEMLRRTLLTDIKPTIYHNLMDKRGQELNRLVIDNMEKKGVFEIDPGLRGRMESYLGDSDFGVEEKKVLKAAHYMATNWEFRIIYRLNSSFYGVEDTKREIESQLAEFEDLKGLNKLLSEKGSEDFLDLIGQLRFQQRWAQTPRIPETSVAGHMMIVAVLTYLLSLEVEACSKRKYNNFFSGLFHDLPEVLTRDIISPVKSSIEGLDILIKEIEDSQMERVIYPLLPKNISDEIRYFTENEFSSKIIEHGKVLHIDSDSINKDFNSDIFSPVDGQLIEFCDKLAAYMEAYISIKHGITSQNLLDGHRHIYSKFGNSKIAGLNTGLLLDYFKL